MRIVRSRKINIAKSNQKTMFFIKCGGSLDGPYERFSKDYSNFVEDYELLGIHDYIHESFGLNDPFKGITASILDMLISNKISMADIDRKFAKTEGDV